MDNISLNFGVIKESILRLKTREFLNGERLGLNDFIKKLNENTTLKKQALIFNIFDTNKQFKKERLAERFINQTLEIMNGVKWEDIIKENREVRILFLDNTHVGSASKEKEMYYNHIHNLIESRCKGSGNYNIAKDQESYEYVVNYLLKEKNNNTKIIEESDEPSISWEFITKRAISSFKERYSHLNESDFKLVKILTSDYNTKFNYFTDLKNENLDKIKKIKNFDLTQEDKIIFETFEQRLNTFNPKKGDNLDDAIISYYELNENLNQKI